MACPLNKRYIDFFSRYGYVVVPSVVSPHQVESIRRDINEAIRHHSGVDVEAIDAGDYDSVSSKSVATVVSPGHGGGMVELYWIPAVENLRQCPVLHDIIRTLFLETWCSGLEGFKHAKSDVLRLSRYDPRPRMTIIPRPPTWPHLHSFTFPS